MESLFTLILLVGVTIVTATPHPAVTANPILRRDATWSLPASVCKQSFVTTAISKLEHPPSTYGPLNYTSWCSNLLRPITVDATYTTLSYTSTRIVTDTIPTTVTDPVSRTSTLLCPTTPAQPSRLCGVWAVMNRKYSEQAFLGRVEDIPSADICMQKCLADNKCQSFLYVGTEEGTGCTFYSLPIAQGVEDLLTTGSYYDRGCPSLLPAGCQSSVPKSTNAPALLKRDDGYPAEDIPYLGNDIDVGVACSCLITSASPLYTISQTLIENQGPQTTTQTTTSTTATRTNYLHLTTSYEYVARRVV